MCFPQVFWSRMSKNGKRVRTHRQTNDKHDLGAVSLFMSIHAADGQMDRWALDGTCKTGGVGYAGAESP